MTLTRTGSTFAPPIPAVQRWVRGVVFPPDRPLIDLSQAAPALPPPEPLRRHMAELVLAEPSVHLYGPILGLPALREEIAKRWSALYGGAIAPAQVGITAGCNEAYAAITSTLCSDGDEIILPVPWYFNQKMWNDMAGIRTVPLATGPDLLPDPEAAAALVTGRTRAIVLVSPNNPGGVEYPPELIHAFRDLARSRGLALILDETYRDFDARTGPGGPLARPHELFADPDWADTVIHLYSFSKAYRLTGHRVGAIVAAEARLAETEKFLDTVTICPAQLGQHGALWGLRHLGAWLAGDRSEILSRRAALVDGFAGLEPLGWRLLGCGAYFAYAEHPFPEPAPAAVRRLVAAAGLLLLPGTMFTPDGAAGGARQVRIAFANTNRAGLAAVLARLEATPPHPFAAALDGSD